MSHFNNIFNKKNVEYSLVNVGDGLPYENEAKVTLNSNQIIFTSINNVLQRLLDNDLYNEALLNQYIDEGKIAGPVVVDSIEEVLNQYDENKKFILSDETGLHVIHKKHVPVSKTLKGRYLNGKKINKISFIDDSYVAVTNSGYYVSDNKKDWNIEVNKSGVDFVDVCYNKNYLIDGSSVLSAFDWILLGNSNQKIELFGHTWNRDGGTWIDFSTSNTLSSLLLKNRVGTKLFSFNGDEKLYIGTKNDGLWSIDGISGHDPQRENGTNNWTINDFVEVNLEDDYERYFLATSFGIKQSKSVDGFRNIEKVRLFPSNVYVYKIIEKNDALYVATSDGLAKLKNNVVSYVYEGLVYDILEYDGAIFIACGPNGIKKLNLDNDSVSNINGSFASKLASFNGDLFFVNSTQNPTVKYIKRGKTAVNSINGFNFSGLIIRDIISTRNALYVVTNKGIKSVVIDGIVSGFGKAVFENINKISFSKNVSDNEVIIQTEDGIFKIENNLNEVSVLSLDVPISIVDAIKTNNNEYYYLDSNGNVYDSSFQSAQGITNASKICYFNDGNTKGLVFIKDGSVYLSGDTIKKISLNQNLFDDLAAYSHVLYGASNKDIYTFDYKTSLELNKKSDETIVDITLKNKKIDSYNVPVYLSATETNVFLNTTTNFIENSDISNTNDPVFAILNTSDQTKIKAIDYIGYAEDSINNKNFIIIGEKNSLSAYSIVPYINDRTYISSDLKFSGKINSEIENLKDFGNLKDFNILLDNGTLKYKTKEPTLFCVDGNQRLNDFVEDYGSSEPGEPQESNFDIIADVLSSINCSLIENSNILVGTDYGLYNVFSNNGFKDFQINNLISNNKAIRKVIDGFNKYIVCTRSNQLTDNIEIYFLDKNIDDPTFDIYQINNNFDDLGYNVKCVNESKTTVNEVSIDFSGVNKIEFPSWIDSNAIVSSLYYDRNIDKYVLGTSNGSGTIRYENGQYAIVRDQNVEISSFEQILSTNSSNRFELSDNLLISNSIDNSIGNNIGGYFAHIISSYDPNDASSNIVTVHSNTEENIYETTLIDFLGNGEPYSLSIDKFIVNFDLRLNNNYNAQEYILSTELLLSTLKYGTGEVSSKSIISTYNINLNGSNTLSSVLFSTNSINLGSNNLSIASIDYKVFVSSENDIEALMEYQISSYLSTTEIINPKIPAVLESGNGFLNQEVLDDDGNPIYSFIVKHSNGKYLFLSSDLNLYEFPKIDIEQSEKNVIYAYIDELGENNRFDDCVCFLKENQENRFFVEPSNRKNKLFRKEDLSEDSNEGNILALETTENETFVLDKSGKIYRCSKSFYKDFSLVVNGFSKIAAAKTNLYILSNNKDLYKVNEEFTNYGNGNKIASNVDDFFISNDKAYYTSNGKLYKENSLNEIIVSSISDLQNYISSEDISRIEIFKDSIKYLKDAFVFDNSSKYVRINLPDNNSFVSMTQKDKDSILLAKSNQIFSLSVDGNNGFSLNRIYSNSNSSISSIGIANERYIVLIDGNDLKVSNTEIGQFPIEFSVNENAASGLSSIARMTNWSDDLSKSPPLILANDKVYYISNVNSFIQNEYSQYSFNKKIDKFVNENDSLYAIIDNSIYKQNNTNGYDAILTSNSSFSTSPLEIISDEEIWTILNSRPCQYLNEVKNEYTSDGSVNGLFKLNKNVYFYNTANRDIYVKEFSYSYHPDYTDEIYNRTINKNVYALLVENQSDYTYNYISSVTAIASAYSGNPNDKWEVRANVSLFDSTNADLCASVNLNYDTTEGMQLIKKYSGNKVFFTNGANGYLYDLKRNTGFTVSFDELENMNDGISKMLFFNNDYIAYGNLLAKFDGFGKIMQFGTPTKEFSILANNFRSGTNKIEILNSVPDFLIGTDSGLRYVYDKVLTRSFYDRNDRENSINKKVSCIELIDREKNHFIVAKDNELYEVTGLKVPKFEKILTLSSDETITSIFPFQKDEYLIATTKGIYTTEHKYSIEDDLRTITLSSVYKIINEELAKILSSHIDQDHRKDSFITKLNGKADTTLSFISPVDRHVDVLDSSIANGVRIVENDIIDSIECGGEDPSKDTYVKVAVSNWATKSIATESFYSDGSFVSKFTDPTTGKTFDISTVPYIVKNWKSGIKEIYIYVPTTATYYLNGPQGMSNSTSTYNFSERKNIPNASIINTLPNGATTLRVYLYNSYFGIKTILAAQCVGNSLPLKIYKDSTNADDSWSGFFNTVVQPSALKTLPRTNDRNVNNVRNCTDSQGRIVIDFSIYGTDAQAIRIIAES